MHIKFDHILNFKLISNHRSVINFIPSTYAAFIGNLMQLVDFNSKRDSYIL